MLFTSKNLNISFKKVLLLVLNIAIVLSAKKKQKSKSSITLKEKANYASRVLNLTDDTFGEFNKTNRQFYMYFMSNTCKKCEIFKTKYEELSDKLYNSNWKIPCVQVNTDLSPKLTKHYDIKKTPKLFFANYEENEFHKFTGKKTPKLLLKFIDLHFSVLVRHEFNRCQITLIKLKITH